MAVVVAPYSQNHFQSLPSLNGARDRFLKLNGDRLVEDLFTKFFVDNGMDRTFGLAMPHRHFDILPGQMMVSYNGTSTPWNASLGPGMHEPQPAVWNFSAFGDLVPIEFDYSKGRKVEMGEKERASVANFKILLEEQNLRDVFGLCAYPGDDFEGTCEITIGSANINLKPKDYPEGLKGTDTAWFFSPPLRKRGCRCTCDNRMDPHSHGTHIYTQSA